MNYREHELQSACVKWFRLQYPKFRKNLFAIPNGAFMPHTVAKKMKAEGMTSGVADLCLMISGRLGPIVWIEMKAPAGAMSKDQKQFARCAMEQGHAYVICKSFDAFQRLVNDQIGVKKI